LKDINIRYLNFRPYVGYSDEFYLNETETSKYFYKSLGNECTLIKGLLEDNGFAQTSGKNWTILWSSGSIKEKYYRDSGQFQKLNHFPRNCELTRKDLLYKNISKFQMLFPSLKPFGFVSEAYLLPNESKFLEEAMEKNSNQLWIIKPVSSSQGRGIYVTNEFKEVNYSII
jgi:hypothetical protein